MTNTDPMYAMGRGDISSYDPSASSAAAQTDARRLFTVSVDSEDENEGEWNDLLYVAARSKAEAAELAVTWVNNERHTREIGEVEAYEYGGSSKVLASFDPNEEHD